DLQFHSHDLRAPTVAAVVAITSVAEVTEVISVAAVASRLASAGQLRRDLLRRRPRLDQLPGCWHVPYQGRGRVRGSHRQHTHTVPVTERRWKLFAGCWRVEGDGERDLRGLRRDLYGSPRHHDQRVGQDQDPPVLISRP